MRVYKSKELGEIRLTEEQYRKLLRRFNPDKESYKGYNYPCICPTNKSGYDCANCKPFRYGDMACLSYVREICGDTLHPHGNLGRRIIKIYNETGREVIRKMYNTLLVMERQ